MDCSKPIDKHSSPNFSNTNATKTNSIDSKGKDETIKIQANVQKILDEFDSKSIKDLLTYKIAKHALENTNMPELANKINTSYVGLWYNQQGKRRWSAEIWLKTMLAVGVANIKS